MSNKGLLDRAFKNVEAMARGEALDLDAQWEEVEAWYRYLEDVRGGDYPVADSFNEAWDELNEQYSIHGKPIMKRGSECKTSDSPLSTLFYYVDMGFYPPPELLFGLFEVWKRYVGARGKMSLEEAFFGPTKKGAGNYAKRTASRFRKVWLTWEFDRMLREGMTRSEVAEELSNQMGGKPDADSILRMMRGFTGLHVSSASEEK
ncbi:hypothetical protein [Marilutibacter spongiae]|uniref:Uncharacterized protein n=1 Tax=Marilutibacter spongiae TaxID=2025720 RepID=A0A7W3TP14_9GAMM|nr:hypothetical protein [Lysobacter spongiae]MBB1061863.1 hypothetical protein [Lysobacter spongiae]